MRLVLLILAALIAAPAPEARALDFETRRMLSAEESAPWRGIGRVNVALGRQTGMCTGTLIAADRVLTAAHCVLNPATGAAYQPGNVHFVAGWRLGQMAAHRLAAAIAVHPGYVHSRRLEPAQVARDMAVIRLEEAIEDETALAFPVGAPRSADEPLTVVSYRQDRPHALTRQGGCMLLGARDGALALDCPITFGVSGSPVFRVDDEVPQVVAVISAMGGIDGEEVAFAAPVAGALPVLLPLLSGPADSPPIPGG